MAINRFISNSIKIYISVVVGRASASLKPKLSFFSSLNFAWLSGSLVLVFGLDC